MLVEKTFPLRKTPSPRVRRVVNTAFHVSRSHFPRVVRESERRSSRARVLWRRELSEQKNRSGGIRGTRGRRESDEKIFVHPREIRGDKLDRRNSSEWNILSISRRWSVGRLARQPTFYCIAIRTPLLCIRGRECKEDVRGRERIRFYLSFHIRALYFFVRRPLFTALFARISWVDSLQSYFLKLISHLILWNEIFRSHWLSTCHSTFVKMLRRFYFAALLFHFFFFF